MRVAFKYRLLLREEVAPSNRVPREQCDRVVTSNDGSPHEIIEGTKSWLWRHSEDEGEAYW